MNASLFKDLSLVLAEPREVGSVKIQAYLNDKPVEMDVAIGRAAAMIRDSHAPAIAGLHRLTMQATRAAVGLASKMRGRIILPPAEQYAVQQSATLGYVMGCDFVIKPGPAQWAADHPVASAIAGRVLHSLFVPPELDSLLQLRAKVRALGAKAITNITQREVNRLAIVLPPDCKVEALSQWHKLAADLQTQIRTCVMKLPDLAALGNGRGAMEVVTWLTGSAGSTDFGDHHGPVDLDIDASVEGIIQVGDEVRFKTPGLALGLNAHVMRFDGIVLRLCEDLTHAIPDPAAALLGRIGDAL